MDWVDGTIGAGLVDMVEGESCGGLEGCFDREWEPRTRQHQFQPGALVFLLYNDVLYLWLYSSEEHHVHYLWKVIVRLIERAGRAGRAGLRRG